MFWLNLWNSAASTRRLGPKHRGDVRTIAPQGVWTWRGRAPSASIETSQDLELMTRLEFNFVRLSECVLATGAQPVAARSDVSTIY
jgi:hypothetical protein